MVYDMAWRGLAWYMIWPIGRGMAYSMAWRDMPWYMISPGGHGMVYGMTWRGMAWYIVWPCGDGIVYDNACRGMAWYVEMLINVNFMCYGIALGYGPVHMWRSRCQLAANSHIQDPFTSRGTVTCMLLFTLGRDS